MATAKKKRPVAKKAAGKKKKSPAGKKVVKAKRAVKKKKPAAKKKASRRRCAVITGAAGFVGGHMVEEFVGAGYRVVATDMPGSDFGIARDAGAEVIEADFTDASSLDAIFKSKVHCVIHVGALYDLGAKREVLMRVNRDGARNMAGAALEAGAERFVYFSTGDIHGQVNRVITEDTPPAPLNSYAESKWEGEKAVRELHESHGLPITVIRPTVVYGPRGRYVASNFLAIPGIVHAIVGRLNFHHDELTVFSGGPAVSWVHARDLTGAVRFLIGKPEAIGNAYNVSDDDPMTLCELFEILFEAFDYRWIPTIPYPTRLIAAFARLGMNMPPFMFDLMTKFMQKEWGEVRDEYGLTDDINPRFSRDFLTFMLGDRVYDNAKIRELGYKLRYPDSRVGLRETFQWYRERHWLPRLEDIKAAGG